MKQSPLFQTISRKTIHTCSWFQTYLDQYKQDGKLKEHYVVTFRPSIAAFVEDKNKNILLIRVKRYPTKSVQWELPAGGIEKKENWKSAAKREVLEETGYRSVNHKLLYEFFPINGISDFVGYAVKCQAVGKPMAFDADEVDEIRWFKPKEVIRMINRNELPDGFSLMALLFGLRSSHGKF